MADILGVGMTHYPGLVGTDEPGGSSLARVLKHNTRISQEKKNPRSWPQEILAAGAATKRRADCDWAEKPPPTLPR